MTDASIRAIAADDDPSIIEALTDLLALDGVQIVGSAHSAESAIRLAGHCRPDVALVDVSMPGGGPAAVRGIRACSPATRVIALSADDRLATRLAMIAAGAVDYVVKGRGDVSEAIASAVAQA